MKSNDIESINISKKEHLITEKSDNFTGDIKKIKIKTINELSHYIKDLKLCNTMDLLVEGTGSYYLKKEEKTIEILRIKNTNKCFECLEYCGLMAGFSVIFIPPILLFGYYAKFPGIVYFILYILLVILQLFNPVIKKLFRTLKKKILMNLRNL